MKLRRPSLLDLALAGALVVWAAMEALLLHGEGSTAERVAWALAFSAPLALRRQFPIGVALTIAAVVALPVVVADGGACYFQATWDVERAEFRSLTVNGEA